MSPYQAPYKPVEIHIGELGTAPLLISCDHSTNRLPSGMVWPEEDKWLVDTHWASDIGAADISRALADEVEAVAVLANFSRLVVDPNRNLDSPSLFRGEAEGRPIALNADLNPEERQRRIDQYYTPYHDVMNRQARNRRGNLLLAIHSFTPLFEGTPRTMEVDVMHVGNLPLAEKWCNFLCKRGLKAVIDKPYSGAAGDMVVAQQYADKSGRLAIMLEIRNDLIAGAVDDFVTILREGLLHTGALP